MKRLNLGCGENLRKGYVNVDLSGNPDIKHDLNKYPYPFKEGTIDFIFAAHVIEHLKEPLVFLKECQRILKKGGRMEIRVPHVTALGGAYGTFGHLHHFHESAIKDVTMKGTSSQFGGTPFKLIKTIVRRGRFMRWQKREIIWIIEKI